MTRFSAFTVALLLVASTATANEGHDHAATKNGQMPAHDMAAMSAAEFARLDTNKDGQLSRSELPKEHKLVAHFGMLDTDKNGTLSAAEFAQGSRM